MIQNCNGNRHKIITIHDNDDYDDDDDDYDDDDGSEKVSDDDDESQNLYVVAEQYMVFFNLTKIREMTRCR